MPNSNNGKKAGSMRRLIIDLKYGINLARKNPQKTNIYNQQIKTLSGFTLMGNDRGGKKFVIEGASFQFLLSAIISRLNSITCTWTLGLLIDRLLGFFFSKKTIGFLNEKKKLIL